MWTTARYSTYVVTLGCLCYKTVDIIANWTTDNDMCINASKTKEMIICFCRHEAHEASLPYIVIYGNVIDRVRQAKVLGVTISADLSWNAHVETIITKARKRVFIIYQLKRAGISQTDLIIIYVTVIRPVLEYACPVWHTSLANYLSNSIDAIQKKCMRTISPGYAYDEALLITDLPTLLERRTKLCMKYFHKLTSPGHKLHHLLPDRRNLQYYCLRTCSTLPAPFARTDRFRRSLLPWGTGELA